MLPTRLPSHKVCLSFRSQPETRSGGSLPIKARGGSRFEARDSAIPGGSDLRGPPFLDPATKNPSNFRASQSSAQYQLSLCPYLCPACFLCCCIFLRLAAETIRFGLAG